MSTTLKRLTDDLESEIAERNELRDRAIELQDMAASVAVDAIRADRRARRKRAAAELVAAALRREVDLPEVDSIRAETLRTELSSRVQRVRASGPKKRKAVEDEQALQEAADAVRHRAGGSVDRVGVLRDRLDGLNDQDLADALKGLISVIEGEERAAAPAGR